MSPKYPLVDEAEIEIRALIKKGNANDWTQYDIESLFKVFDKWMQHPQLRDPNGDGLLRVTVLNEITFLISEPIIGDHAWEYIRDIAKRLGQDDPYDLRESWRITTFEVAAEPPEYPDFLEKLFSLAADNDTRWAVFGAYENVPWRLRPHAHKYSRGMISDEDCDQWLIEEGWGEDEILMKNQRGARRCSQPGKAGC